MDAFREFSQHSENVMTDYQNNGFANRAAYLKDLCEEYPTHIVYALADLLGPTEDFDGLVTSLEDFSEENFGDC
jgi:hypothetical protein